VGICTISRSYSEMSWTVACDTRIRSEQLQSFQSTTRTEPTPTIGRQIAKTVGIRGALARTKKHFEAKSMLRLIGKLERFIRRYSGVGTSPNNSLSLALRTPVPAIDRILSLSIEEGGDQ